MYGKAFFDLQLQFAHTVMALSGLPLERTLLEYTNLYVRLGLGRDFDPEHPTWREYVAGLRDAEDIGEWTYRFYRMRPETEPPGIVATRGSFSYARLSGDRIRLHFRSAESDGRSSLGSDRRGQFLDRHGEVRESVTRPFLDRLEGQASLDTLDQCFPFQVLTLDAPASDFYELYGIETTDGSDHACR
jgi:hypothetical protein